VTNTQKKLDALLSAIPDDPYRFSQLCRQVEDWDELFNCALGHGVESLLHYYLIQTGFKLPPVVEERVHRWQLIKDLWQTHAQTTLDEALRALQSVNVRAVALKGPVLGERFYPDPRVRSSADLDLLVAPEDLGKAAGALKTIGFGIAKETEARFLRRYHYHVILRRSCPPVIELHFRLSDGFGVEIAAEEFLSRATLHRTALGAVTHILSPEDEML